MQKVLILDANQRSALAATRSLGRRGVPVIVADETRRTLAGSSRYCRGNFTYSSPNYHPKEFIQSLDRLIRKNDISVVLPMAEITTALVLMYRNTFRQVSVPFASIEAFNALTDKWRLFCTADALGIRTPRTHFVRGKECLNGKASRFGFPVVLKPYRSKIWSQGRWINATVKYANSPRELINVASQYEYFDRHPFLVQEYIPGKSQGVFAIYQHGSPLAFFAHRRLREKPPSGGVSVLSESISVDPRACRAAETILEHVKWHGVAMVEFHVAQDGTPYLMEVNARFWGSLQLAIDAGVDFPWLAYQLATGQEIDRIKSYKVGIKNRWLLGDMAHLWRLFVPSGTPLPPGSNKWRTLWQFMKPFESNMKYEVNRWDDLAPFFSEIRSFLTRL